MNYLRELVADNRATDVERKIFALLSERFDAIRRGQERELLELTKQQRRVGTFEPSERQRTSSKALPV
jgi:hypothetical protein